MKQELDRVKNDVETIQKAMGLAPSMGQEWILWMKRDMCFNAWWCLPGLIVIVVALLPLEHGKAYFGMAPDRWARALATAALMGMAIGRTLQLNAKGGRPEGVMRDLKWINFSDRQCWRLVVVLAVQLLIFFAWSSHYHIAFAPRWAGLFILLGSVLVVAALSAREWALLGFGIPFLAYSLCLPLTEGHYTLNEVLLGTMFIAVALSVSVILFWEIRQIERQHESH